MEIGDMETRPGSGDSHWNIRGETTSQMAVLVYFSAMSCDEGQNLIYIRDCPHLDDCYIIAN